MSETWILDSEHQKIIDRWVGKMLDALPSGDVSGHLSFLYVRAIQLESHGEGLTGRLGDGGYQRWRHDPSQQLWYEIEIVPERFEEWPVICAHEMGHILHDYMQDWPNAPDVGPDFLSLQELSCDQFALRYLARPGVREEFEELLEPLYREPYRVEFPLRPNPNPPRRAP